MSETGASKSQVVFVNLVIIGIFGVLMTAFMHYFEDGEPNVHKVAMSKAADAFSTTITNAHWKWIAEGKPIRVVLALYNTAGQETGRTPLMMNHYGWPRVKHSSEDCGRLWRSVLDLPLTLNSLKVYSEFYDGADTTGKAIDSKCVYRISSGPNFEYYMYTGRVVKSEK